MGLADPLPLIDGLGETTSTVLADSAASDRPLLEVAEALAWRRVRAGEALRKQ
jgi:hypothetical protein